MYNPPSGNYGRGLSIAYFPTSSDTGIFNGFVSHIERLIKLNQIAIQQMSVLEGDNNHRLLK